ncbi:MAG: CSLREA domain-containing protein [Mesorhizobium sp.]|uniref:CSLREA domain-containing protein n=1 Tax=Mesorhizobium sp. TaxID=1871066 RepID=UPI0012185CE2|nr:CSLREA domain-containing protein [Mesorhizobium sp.]TIP27006.1 MAG: CSLREA domain-containing protein [Mesorhizobium sp.]
MRTIQKYTVVILAALATMFDCSGAMGGDVPVTVTITSVTNISAGDFAGGDPDFFTRIRIAGSSFESGYINNAAAITPGWTFTRTFPMGTTGNRIPIRIEILDFDGATSAHDLIDVDPDVCNAGLIGFGCTYVTVNRPGADTRGLDLTLDLTTGLWTGFSSASAADAAGSGTTPTCVAGDEGESATICLSITLGSEEFVVTKTDDTNDGLCEPTDCSLREALSAAGDGDTVILPDFGWPQPYTLTFQSGTVPPDDPADEPGHLKITQKDLKIKGPATGAIIKQTHAHTRVFDIHDTARGVEISNLTITGGQAGLTSTAAPTHLHGGGIHNHGDVTLRNVTISNNNAHIANVAVGGGGGFYNAGTAKLINVTIAYNAAVSRAGGIDGMATSLTNTLVVNNTGPDGNCRASAVGGGGGGNLQFPGATCGQSVSSAPALPVYAPDAEGTYPLVPLQQGGAIDAGTNIDCPPTDQLGFVRPFDGNGDGNPICDIGAREDDLAVIQQPLDPTTGGPGPVTIDINSITAPGRTVLTISGIGPAPPANYLHGSPTLYYGLRTSARFTEAKVCISYTGRDFLDESDLRLFQHIDGRWQDETASLDTASDVICGRTTTLTGFGIFQPARKRQ